MTEPTAAIELRNVEVCFEATTLRFDCTIAAGGIVAVAGACIREDSRAIAVQCEHVRARVEIEVANENLRRHRGAELVGDEELAARAGGVQPNGRARHGG